MIRYFTSMDSVTRDVMKVADQKPGLYMQKEYKTVNIYDLAKKYDCPIKVTGIRPGEKIVEDLRYKDEEPIEYDNLLRLPSAIRIKDFAKLREDVKSTQYGKYNLQKVMWKWIPGK